MASDTALFMAWTTCPDLVVGKTLAQALIREHLAVCVNIGPPSVSIYPWQGEVAEEAEVVLTMKTSRECLPALKAYLDTHHPYDVPECVVVPIVDGLPAYLDWASAYLERNT